MSFCIWQKPSYYGSKFFNFIDPTKEATKPLAKMQSFHLIGDKLAGAQCLKRAGESIA